MKNLPHTLTDPRLNKQTGLCWFWCYSNEPTVHLKLLELLRPGICTIVTSSCRIQTVVSDTMSFIAYTVDDVLSPVTGTSPVMVLPSHLYERRVKTAP